MNGSRHFAVALTLTSVAACNAGPSNLGQNADILWWTDHETGGLSDWVDYGGSMWTAAGGQLDIVTSPVRSGRHALRSAVTSSSTDILSAAVVQRAGVMQVDAYYSAWFFVPAAATTTSYWLFFKFRSQCAAGDPSTPGPEEIWDLDFVPDRTGAAGMQFQLFSHIDQSSPLSTVRVPIGRWFQVEALLRPRSDNTGQLTIWEGEAGTDGAVIFDVQNQPTIKTPSTCVEWSVGGITGVITPPSATFYVDDAAMSSRRLGPSYPVFWRGH